MTGAEGVQSPKAEGSGQKQLGLEALPSTNAAVARLPVGVSCFPSPGALRGAGWTGSETVPEAMGGSRCQPHTQHLTVQISVPVLLTPPQPGLPSRRVSREAVSTGSHVLTSTSHCSSPPGALWAGTDLRHVCAAARHRVGTRPGTGQALSQ